MGRLGETKVLIIMIAVFGVLILGLLVVTYLQQSELARLKTRRGSVQREVNNLKREKAEIPKLEEEIADIQEEIEHFQRILPKQEERTKMVTMFKDIARSTGTNINNISFYKDKQSGEYEKWVLQLRITQTPFYNFAEFVNRIENFKRLIIVDQFQMTGNPADRKDVPLEIQMSVYTFYYVEKK